MEDESTIKPQESNTSEGRERLKLFLGHWGTYVTAPDHGIKHGLELSIDPDTIVPGTSQTFRRRRLLKSLRLKAAANRWQCDPNSRALQQVVNHEYLSEDQLNILLAPSRAAATAMQEVEQESNLDPIGHTLSLSQHEHDDSRAEALEQKVRQAVENFQAMPEDIRPSNDDIADFINPAHTLVILFINILFLHY